MKANEFIKEYGLGEAVELVNSVKFVVKIKDIVCDPCFFTEDCTLSYKELKRLVESHEIIQKDFESVEMADYEHMISGWYSDPYWVRVKQAITDVESCQ